MKNFTYLFLAGLFSFVMLSVNAQLSRFNPDQQKPVRQSSTFSPQRSCPTFELMEQAFQADPAARLRYARTQQLLDQQLQLNRTNPNAQFRTESIINVPVVVHVLLPAAQQALVTDAIIQSQIDTLNFYYGGSPLNSDSLRVFTPFRTTYGRTEIRFCMAQRTPADVPTNGIDRIISSTVYGSGGNPGATVVWNPVKYLNIWVVNFGTSGILGYSYTPGSWAPADSHQGFVNDYRAFGSGPGTSSGGFHYNEYNQGKTAVHEIGHYFNLQHTWGPNNSGNPSCTLSDGCSDTPPCVGPFFGCPSAVPVLDACSPAAPGVMWQNHMDYADDRCMVLFTNEQCARMMTAIATAADRVGLLTSNGCVPPAVAAGNDARISAIINPPNGSAIACSAVTPVVTIQNMGSNLLTQAKINILLNGTPVAGSPVNWTGSLTQGSTANVTLPSVTIATLGLNTLKIHTTLPNNLADAVPANDTSISVITKTAPVPVPTGNDFEASFLPPGWSISNPDGDVTWGWYIPGASGVLDTATAIDNYNYDLAGFTDDVRTTVINTTSLLANDSLLISFDLAHKNYPGQNDILQVLVSTDCGATFTNVWQKAGAALATAGASTAFYTTPVPADWVKQKVSIGQNLFGGGQIIVVFRNVNDFGNVVWLDNINIGIKPRKDMQALTIVRPNATECAPPFIPSLTVRNNGGELVTAFKTGYILDGGTPVIQSHNIPLVPGASTTVTFASLTPAAGTHSIKMFVADPLTASVGPDGTPANDTITRAFIVPVTAVNVVQGFEGSTFVPANWSLLNPNNNVSWVRKTPGKSSDFSSFIDNYNNNTINQLDGLQSPPVNTIGADSVIITFDVAHKDYPGSLDRLRVLVSTNCGTSFTSVYSKSGPTLATAGSSVDDFTDPGATEWRNETIRLNNTFTGGNILVQFENRNDFGNNIFIDNVNIAPKFKRDLEVLSVSPDIVCTTAFTPTATIRNRGTETVTGYSISYTVGTGAPVTQVITGVTLASNATITVPLAAGTLAIGANNIKVYTFAPVTASGTGDQYTINDTIAKTSYAAATVSAPLAETFEGAAFVPSGWAISNPDGATTWQKAGVGFKSNGSAYLKNFGYLATGQKDGLFTPVFNFTGVDSVRVSFDLSAATKVAATGSIPMDTLEVLVTKDCGATFTSVYKKGGTQLQTIYDNTPVPTEFTPNAYYLWRKESIDLSSYSPNGPLQLIFRNTTNNQNNVFIDNVNFSTRTLPARLRSEGYLISPTPFTEQFNIWFVQPPTDLSYVTVFNASGQLVWNKTFGSGNTSNVINVDLTGKSAGIYVVNFGYSDKSKDKQVRILKSN